MRILIGQGVYIRKATKEAIPFSFEYPVFNSIEAYIAQEGETKTIANLNRMLKVDAGNTAREKAKRDNGDSVAVQLTPEQKAEQNLQKKADRELLRKLKSNPDVLAQLG